MAVWRSSCLVCSVELAGQVGGEVVPPKGRRPWGAPPNRDCGVRSVSREDWPALWLQHDLQQWLTAPAEPFEPGWTVAQRRDGTHDLPNSDGA